MGLTNQYFIRPFSKIWRKQQWGLFQGQEEAAQSVWCPAVR